MRGPTRPSRPAAPRNGVMTAVNDFLSEVEAPVTFTSVIGFFGLGVLYDAASAGGAAGSSASESPSSTRRSG